MGVPAKQSLPTVPVGFAELVTQPEPTRLAGVVSVTWPAPVIEMWTWYADAAAGTAARPASAINSATGMRTGK